MLTSGPLERSVHGRAGDAEELGELGAGVLAGAVQFDEVSFLRRRELGLLAAEAALGLGDLHALARTRAYEVGFELGHHGEHVEQQAPDGVGRVVHRAAKVEADLAAGEVVGDVARVGKRAGEAVELGHDERVAGAAGRERLAQSRPVGMSAGDAVVDVDALKLDAERP